MDADSKSRPLHENLDTTFVNLWSLLRSLTQRGFIGRVHVESTDYSADVFMNGSAAPLVHEIDRAAGTETFEEAALHRLVLHSRETPGKITVFEGATDAADRSRASATTKSTPSPPKPATAETATAAPPVPVHSAPTETRELHPLAATEPAKASAPIQTTESSIAEIYPSGSYNDWPAILKAIGELIGAIEHGINASGGNFAELFRAARLELADDYNFLDPISQTFVYDKDGATLIHQPAVGVFVSGLSEALRRTIDRAAAGERARRIRERIALEMLSVARRHNEVLERSGFRAQLDRIAGTRVM